MRIFLLKNVVKESILNSRYVFRHSSSIKFNPSLYIPKRHLQLDNTNYLLKKKLPLVRRLYGNNNDGGDKTHYFSLLSTKDLSPVKQLHLPFPKIEVVGSCNGVVCFEDDETEGGRTALWNPSTNDFKFLPHTCIQRYLSAAYIAFSPTMFISGFIPRSSKNGVSKTQSAGNQRHKSSLVGTSETTRATTYPKSFCEWLAGIVDGDGSIQVSKKGCTSLEITMGLEDLRLLRYIQNMLGGSIKMRAGAKAYRYRLHNHLAIKRGSR